jgi:hypothetical protein
MIKAGLMAMAIVGLLALVAAKDKTEEAGFVTSGIPPVITDTTVLDISRLKFEEHI